MSEEKVNNGRHQHLQYSNVDLSPECFPEPAFEKKLFQPIMDPETGRMGHPCPYYIAPLIHKTRDSKGRLRTDTKFLVEGPILSSVGGIQLRKGSNNKYVASIPVLHDIYDEEIRKYCGIPMDAKQFAKLPVDTKSTIGFLTQLYLRCISYVFDNRNKLDLHVRCIEALEAYFVNTLKWENDIDGELIEGRSPFRWYPILLKGNISNPNHIKAPFSIPCKKTPNNRKGQIVLPWSRLQNVELRFRPLLEFTHIDVINDKITIQSRIISAVVYGFTSISTICRQEVALANAREDEDLLQELQYDLEDSIEADPEGTTMTVLGRDKITIYLPPAVMVPLLNKIKVQVDDEEKFELS